MGENYTKIELPTRCLPYEGIDPEGLSIREFVGEDEKIIADFTTSNFDKKSAVLVGRVLKGINPLQLTLGDRLFVLIWEVINSYGKIYPLDLMCPSCKKITVDVDLSQLEILPLPDDYMQPYEVKLSDGSIVKLRLLTVADEIQAINYENTGNSSWLYRYALTMVDEEKKVWDRLSFLEKLGTKDIGLIRAFHEKYKHGLNMNYTYECPKCGGGDSIEVPFQLDILLPTGATVARAVGVKI